jgi:hypothetical protein
LNNPDAAFYEQKHFWKWFGPWEWPHNHFMQKKVFVDEPSVTLFALGLSYRAGGLRRSRDDLALMFYYNTLEDLEACARAQGKQFAVTFGQGWSYRKTQGFRDWRILRDSANIMVCNLSEHDARAVIHFRGVAVGQTKTLVIAHKHQVSLPANRYGEWKLPILLLKPGWQKIELMDPKGRQAKAALLVDKLTLSSAP